MSTKLNTLINILNYQGDNNSFEELVNISSSAAKKYFGGVKEINSNSSCTNTNCNNAGCQDGTNTGCSNNACGQDVNNTSCTNTGCQTTNMSC